MANNASSSGQLTDSVSQSVRMEDFRYKPWHVEPECAHPETSFAGSESPSSVADAVYVHVVPWSGFPIVPSYPHYPHDWGKVQGAGCRVKGEVFPIA